MYSQSQAGTQPNNTNKPPRQKKAAKDDMSVRPKSSMPLILLYKTIFFLAYKISDGRSTID